MTRPDKPSGQAAAPKRKIRAGDTFTADEDAEVEVEGVDPDAAIVPEAEQVGDRDHEGGPGDGGK
jgi:hypothetical protein